MEDEDKNIKELLLDVSKKLDETKEKDKQKKGFKLPWKGKLSNKNVKDGFTTIIYIQDNREIKFLKAPIKDQTINVEGIPRIASTDYMLTHKGKPVIIVPQSSVKPYNPTTIYETAVQDKMTAQGWRLLINIIQSDGIAMKKKISMTMILIGIVVVIVAFYLLSKGGLKL